MLSKRGQQVLQLLITLTLGVLAAFALIGAWQGSGTPTISIEMMLITIILTVGIAGAYLYPIHIGKNRKVEMSTISLYLLAVLLPSAPLAGAAAGLGVLAGELMVRRSRGNFYSDCLSSAARYTIAVTIAACAWHLLPANGTLRLLAVAALMFAIDTITLPLLVAPLSRERPLQALVSSVKDSGTIEASQYLLGLLGALAASVQLWGILLLILPTVLIYLAFKSVKELQSGTRHLLESMADTVDLRDPYTGGHSRRVAALSAAILNEMGVLGPEAELTVAAARLHDIGKIGIPDEVLMKPGRLTPEEEAIMQTHSERGAELLKRYPDFARGVEIVMHHHEAWDGSGYPHGRKGLDIPFGARVIAVADSFDAMTSDRPYRAAMPLEKALTILRDGAGRQWDQQIIDAFMRTGFARSERRAATLLAMPQLDERQPVAPRQLGA